MKRTFTTLLVLIIATVSSYAATYYSRVTGVSIHTNTNWVTGTDGTGTSPAVDVNGFTGSGDVFIIQNGHTMTCTAARNFGTNSTLRILGGGTLTATFTITVTNFVVENGGYYLHNSTALALIPGTASVVFGETSTLEVKRHLMTAGATLPHVVFGNIIVDYEAGGNWIMTNATTFETKGDLTIKRSGATNVRYLMLTGNDTEATIGGDLKIINDGEFYFSNSAAASNGKSSLTVKGNLIIEDAPGGIDEVATFGMARLNDALASFSLIVEGNTEVRSGNLIGSNASGATSSNINMDFKGDFTVGAAGSVIFSKSTSGTIKALSMVVGGNFDVNGTFTGTAGAPWTSAHGGATIYFKGGVPSSTFKMKAGEGTSNIAYVVAKNKTLTLQSPLVTDKFLAVAGHVAESGFTITGTINRLNNSAISFNGDIAANTQSVITLQDGATVSGLALVPGMEVTSLTGSVLAPNTVITQIVDESTITVSRAAVNGATAYVGAGVSPVNFNIEAFAGTLPLTIVNFKATRETSGVRLQWKTAQENNVKEIVLERSTDGVAFTRLVALSANNNPGEHTYAYLDRSASTTLNNYYRLKIVDNDGSSVFSEELVVSSLALSVAEIKLYPNPVDAYLEVNFPAAIGKGSVKVLTVDGRIVKQETVSKGQGSLRVGTSSLAKGLYILVYEDESGKRYTNKFIKN